MGTSPPGYLRLLGTNAMQQLLRGCRAREKNMGLKIPKKTHVKISSHLNFKTSENPKRNQRPRKVLRVKRRPQSLNLKDPTGKKNYLWTTGKDQSPPRSRLGSKKILFSFFF